MSSVHSFFEYAFDNSILKIWAEFMNEASFVNECLPLPPIPIKSPFPNGFAMILASLDKWLTAYSKTNKFIYSLV